jgi:DNA-binding MarR family transcriptional regulator
MESLSFETVNELFFQSANKLQLVQQRRYDQGAGMPLFPAEAMMLTLVQKNPGLTVSELAVQLGYTTSAGSQTLKKLEARGLVALRSREGNKKVRIPSLTPEGSVAAQSIRGFQSDVWRDMLDLWDPLDDHHKEFLVEFFRSLNVSLERKLNRGP